MGSEMCIRDRAMAVKGSWDEIGPLLKEKYEGLLDRITLYIDFRPGFQNEFWRILVKGFSS